MWLLTVIACDAALRNLRRVYFFLPREPHRVATILKRDNEGYQEMLSPTGGLFRLVNLQAYTIQRPVSMLYWTDRSGWDHRLALPTRGCQKPCAQGAQSSKALEFKDVFGHWYRCLPLQSPRGLQRLAQTCHLSIPIGPQFQYDYISVLLRAFPVITGRTGPITPRSARWTLSMESERLHGRLSHDAL